MPKRLRGGARRTSLGRQVRVYIPGDLLGELEIEAARLDRSISWLLQRAWTFSKPERQAREREGAANPVASVPPAPALAAAPPSDAAPSDATVAAPAGMPAIHDPRKAPAPAKAAVRIPMDLQPIGTFGK